MQPIISIFTTLKKNICNFETPYKHGGGGGGENYGSEKIHFLKIKILIVHFKKRGQKITTDKKVITRIFLSSKIFSPC